MNHFALAWVFRPRQSDSVRNCGAVRTSTFVTYFDGAIKVQDDSRIQGPVVVRRTQNHDLFY